MIRNDRSLAHRSPFPSRSRSQQSVTERMTKNKRGHIEIFPEQTGTYWYYFTLAHILNCLSSIQLHSCRDAACSLWNSATVAADDLN